MSGLFSMASRTRLLRSRRGSASSGAATASPPAGQPPNSVKPRAQLMYRKMREEDFIGFLMNHGCFGADRLPRPYQKRREAPAFMPGMDRRWARRAQCPRAQQDL